MLQPTQRGRHGFYGRGMSKILQPKGAKRLRAVIFLQCPRAVKFLAVRDRKIHDAQAEWSVTSLLIITVQQSKI